MPPRFAPSGHATLGRVAQAQQAAPGIHQGLMQRHAQQMQLPGKSQGARKGLAAGTVRPVPACGPGKQATPQHPVLCPR